MAIRAGHKFTVGDFDFVGLFVVKTAIESVASSTTLQNDDELFLPLAANAKYKFNSWIESDGSTAADIKMAFTVPAGAVINWTSWGAPSGVGTPWTTHSHAVISASGTSFSYAVAGAGTPLVCRPAGFLTTSGTSGNLQLQWAQVISNATASRVYDFSYLEATRVA